jgi:microtubule-associated protein-like 6
MTNTGAKELLYFESPKGNRINIRDEDIKKLNWNTFTSVLGPTCLGIWPPCSDITDINSTCLNKNRTILATGDDFGLIKLFEYPCLVKIFLFL